MQEKFLYFEIKQKNCQDAPMDEVQSIESRRVTVEEKRVELEKHRIAVNISERMSMVAEKRNFCSFYLHY